MTVMTSVIPHGRPFTVDDLQGMPDDGNRYELIDGTLLVTPAPGWPHQEMGATLYVLLREHRPPDLRVLIAPFDVRTAFDSEVQPDVLVARYADLTLKNLPVAPVLVAEVLSRSTSLVDRNLKKAHYERIGVPYYWILDPRATARSRRSRTRAAATRRSRGQWATSPSLCASRSTSRSSRRGCSTGCAHADACRVIRPPRRSKAAGDRRVEMIGL